MLRSVLFYLKTLAISRHMASEGQMVCNVAVNSLQEKQTNKTISMVTWHHLAWEPGISPWP